VGDVVYNHILHLHKTEASWVEAGLVDEEDENMDCVEVGAAAHCIFLGYLAVQARVRADLDGLGGSGRGGEVMKDC
jgi:hypothetical protein